MWTIDWINTDIQIKTAQTRIPHWVHGFSGRVSDKVTKWVSAIVSWNSILKVWDGTEQLSYYINDSWIRDILQNNPLIVVNIRQKLKSYYRKCKTMQDVDKEKEESKLINDIIKLFILPESIKYPHSLERLVRSEFIENADIKELVSESTPYSFIEQPIDIIQQLDKSKKVNSKGFVHEPCKQIEGVIRWGLARNNNEHMDVSEIHRAIMHYARTIYRLDIWKNIPDLKNLKISNSENLDIIIERIAKIVRDAFNWKSRSWNAWNMAVTAAAIYLKWFFAWWYLWRIRINREKSLQKQHETLIDLEQIFGKWKELTKMSGDKKRSGEFEKDDDEHERIFEYNYTSEHDGKTYVLEVGTRIKSMKSILTKLVADDTYNDIDSVFDLLWFRIFLWNTPPEVKKEILLKIGHLYKEHSFILKNKRLFQQQAINDAKRECLPLTIESDIKIRSSSAYMDAKFAWHTKKREWTMEFQLFNNKSDPNPKWEAHHTIIEAFRIMQWWVRFTGYITWWQVRQIIHENCIEPNDNSGLKAENIYKLIFDRWLVPYLIFPKTWHPYVIFWFNWYEHLLTWKYPDDPSKENYSKKLEPKAHWVLLKKLETL